MVCTGSTENPACETVRVQLAYLFLFFYYYYYYENYEQMRYVLLASPLGLFMDGLGTVQDCARG